MKVLSAFTLIILVFVGCTSAKYQEMQNERDRLRAAHEDALRKHDPRRLETDLTEKLIGKWQFVDMEVTEGDLSEEIAALQYERHARTRKNLTLEFFMDRNVFRRYRSKNGDTEVTGGFKISSRRYGDESFPYLRVFRDTGLPLYEFLTGMSASRLKNQDTVSMKAAEDNWLGISVTDDRLSLSMDGDMELTPNGWARSGGIRCIFQRIK
jgi:hypothetical protein